MSFDQALEAEIREIMSPWPAHMEAALKSADLEGFAGGDRLWQATFEAALMHPDSDPDNLSTIIWLAERGYTAAREALRRYTKTLLENPKADLPSSLRAYVGRHLDGLIPLHPEDRDEVVKTMLRNVAIRTMIDVGRQRWPAVPDLYSGRLHSLAWFVAEVMTNYGIPLSERHVRRIYQDRNKLAERLAKFLIGKQTI